MARKTVLVCDSCGKEVGEAKGATLRVTYADARRGAKQADLCDERAGTMAGRPAAGRARWESGVGCGCRAPRRAGVCGYSRHFATLPAKLNEQGAFPIIGAYLRLAAQGERIAAFRADEYACRDLGTPESVAKAAEEMRGGRFAAL